jgi:hypothetical protein
MSHPQGLGPGRLREEFARAPQESRPGHTQGSAVAFERPLWSHPTRRCMSSAAREGSFRGD